MTKENVDARMRPRTNRRDCVHTNAIVGEWTDANTDERKFVYVSCIGRQNIQTRLRTGLTLMTFGTHYMALLNRCGIIHVFGYSRMWYSAVIGEWE